MMGGSFVDRVRGLVRRSGEVRGRPAILLYHRIATEVFDPWSLAVSPEHFAEQMEWLACNRTILPLAEFARTHSEGTLASDATAITFDDGYACNVQVAAPILERLGLPATIFLPAEIVEQGRPFWWDELQAIVIDHPGEETRLDEEAIALGPRRLAATSPKDAPLFLRCCGGVFFIGQVRPPTWRASANRPILTA